jgi:aspartate racemase
MKTLGIVGGIAPESTIEYYRLLIARFRERQPDGSYPRLLLNSIDLARLLALAGAGSHAELTGYLLDAIGSLARAGAEIGLFASNTPHVVYDQVRKASPIPLLSIVECAADRARALGVRRVGLLGTRFTMEGQFYPEVFARQEITVVTPDAEHRRYVHEKYLGELVHAVFLPETRDRLLAIIEGMRRREGIEALILGGTELPFLLRESPDRDFPFLDTTRIHVEAAVTRMLE